MRIKQVLGLLLLIVNTSSFAADKTNYQVHKLSENAYVLTYLWGENNATNIGAIVADEGVLLINTMMIGQVDELETELAKLTDNPVKYVINSNSDWYNTSANKYFADKGATIIGHKNVVNNTGSYSQLRFDDSFEMTFGNEVINAYLSGGHSSAHINIQLKNANAIFVADSFSMRWRSPLGPKGIKGHLNALDMLIELSDEKTTIVPGNVAQTRISDINDLKKERTNREAFFALVDSLQQQGKSLEEIQSNKQVKTILGQYDQYGLWKDKHWPFSSVKFHAAQQRTKEAYKAGVFDDYLGSYNLADGRNFEVYVKDGGLYARFRGIFDLSLVPTGNKDQFWFNSDNFARQFVFVRDATNKVTNIQVRFENETDSYLAKLATLNISKI